MGMTQTATRLITRFGQAAVLSKPGEETGPEYDPVIGPPIEQAVTVAVTEYTLAERAASFIADTALRVFMTADVEPATADKLIVGGVTYSIHHVGTLGPDGVVICYELRVQL